MPDNSYTEDEANKIVKELGFHRLHSDLMLVSMPDSLEEATDMLSTLSNSFVQVLAITAFYHIEDHDGYSCATGMIEGLPQQLSKDARSRLDLLLNLENMKPIDSDPNAEVRDSILKEIDENG